MMFDNTIGTGRGKSDNWDEWMRFPHSLKMYEISSMEIEVLKSTLLSFQKENPEAIPPPKGGYYSTNDVVVAKIWCCILLSRMKLRKTYRYFGNQEE
jgi:hypothetical protein